MMRDWTDLTTAYSRRHSKVILSIADPNLVYIVILKHKLSTLKRIKLTDTIKSKKYSGKPKFKATKLKQKILGKVISDFS